MTRKTRMACEAGHRVIQSYVPFHAHVSYMNSLRMGLKAWPSPASDTHADEMHSLHRSWLWSHGGFNESRAVGVDSHCDR